ncbi:MAG: hypothetical protein HRT44_11750 [Bdellovibrionales bacterium]|nr:hypothetical protein [Bdellovibrionales bacterium]
MIVNNPNRERVSISGEWLLRFYNQQGRLIRTEKEKEYLNISRNDSEEFVERFYPNDSTRCTARYIGR